MFAVAAMGMLLPILAQSAPAAPLRPTVNLEYTTPERIKHCPRPARFRASLARRVKHRVVDTDAEREVSVVVTRVERGLRAVISVSASRAGKMALIGQRTLEAGRTECRPLIDAAAFSIALALEIDDAPQTQAFPAPPPEPSVLPEAVVSDEARFVRPRSDKHPKGRPWVTFGVMGGAGTAPWPAVGLTVAAEWRAPVWSLGVEGRLALPSQAFSGRGEVQADLRAGGVSACIHSASLAGCGLIVAGALYASASGLANRRSVHSPFLAAGVRGRSRWPLSDRLSVRAWLDLVVPAVQNRLRVDQRIVWQTATIGATLGLGMAWQL